MTTPLIHFGIYIALSLIGTILFIVVLIKLFKNEGVLKGLLGLFIGLYTFIWGWMKHKELKLTKIMIVWTATIVLMLVQAGVFGVDMVTSFTQEIQDERQVAKKKIDFKKVRADKKKKAAKKKPVARKPNKDVDWNQKAQILWKDGKYTKPDKALKHLDNFVNLNPKSPEAYNNRGVARLNLKKYEDAIEDFDKAINLNPEHAMAYQNRANAYYELNDYKNALADYGRALELKPNYARAYVNRGLVHYQMDRVDNACGDFRKACDLDDCDGYEWAMQEELCR